jgi:hypothetical protein
VDCHRPGHTPINAIGTSFKEIDMTSQVGAITQAGDVFYMDGQGYDIETLTMTLQMQRAENIDAQLVDQSRSIKEKNAILARAQKALALARGARPTKASGGVTVEPPEYTAFINELGIKRDTTGGDLLHNQAEWDKNIQHLQGFIDSQNSNSQMDMVRLQSLMNKRNQAFEMMTNALSKFNKTKDSVISNMR